MKGVYVSKTLLVPLCDFNYRCGLRGGYMESINIDTEVFGMLKKLVSAKLCPTTLGQVSVHNCNYSFSNLASTVIFQFEKHH